MKELNIKYDFDLGRTIKSSKKKTKQTKKDEKILEANYILESFAQNELTKEGIEVTKDDIEKAIVKTIEISKTKIKKIGGTYINRKKVIKQYYMMPKEKLEVIRQVTESICKNGNKQFIRNTSILEIQDMIKEELFNENGDLNRKNSIVKKLLPSSKPTRTKTAK